MRITPLKRRKITLIHKIVIIISIILLILLSTYVGVFVYAIQDYNSFAKNLDPPDPDSFMEENSTRLYGMAMWYEENIAKYHMPHNMIVDTRYNIAIDPHEVIGYGMFGDSAEWTGNYLIGEASRYAVHKRDGNTTLAEYALKNITRALNGIEKILYVAGYDGMARYAWPVEEFGGSIDPLPEGYYLETWNGSVYVVLDDTSRDMHNGIIAGLGFTYKIVDNVTIRAYVKTLVERMLDVLIRRGFLYVGPDGNPNGTDLDVGLGLIGTSGVWTLAYLQVGVLVNPEKYGELYETCAYNLDYIWRGNMPETSALNTVQGYYGLLLDWELMFILIILEDDPVLRNIYMEYINGMYDLTKYDRNALFNVWWLIFNGANKTNDLGYMNVIGDVTDCLMRYYESKTRFPGRNFAMNNDDITNPTATKWLNFFEEGLGSVLYPFYNSVFQFENISNVALTPDKRPQTDYLWSRPPYWYFERGPSGDYEGPSVDYTIVYWLARLYGIIDPPEDYSIKLQPDFSI